MQSKDLAGLSKTNRVLSESHTRTRTNKTIWHYFYWSTVLISSSREIKDFLRAHKENQLKLHILSSFWSKRKQRCSFIFFPKKTYTKKIYRADWVKKQDTVWGIFYLLSLLFFNKYIIDSWFVHIIHSVDFSLLLPQAAINHTTGSQRPAAIVLRKSTAAQNWNISR